MKRLLAAALLMGLLMTGAPQPAQAQTTDDFTITSFSSDQTLSRADRQGELRVIEKIRVDFTGSNHGIIRAIPNSYKGNSLNVSINQIVSETGAPSEYKKSTSNGNTELKIGDPDRTVTGEQEYTIDYTVQNVIGFYKDHAELYWDVNGDQWDQATTVASVTLHLPSDIRVSSQMPKCYAGGYGSTTQNCQINLAGNALNAVATGLQPRQTLTYVIGFQNGYFQPATAGEKLRDRAVPFVEFLLPVLMASTIGLLWWLRSGRDAKVRGTIVPAYDAPAGLTPMQADGIVHFTAGNLSLTATLIDLARRSYLKITELRQDRLIGKDKLSYTLELKQSDTSKLNAQETELLKALFTDMNVGTTVKLDELKNKLYKTATEIKTATSQQLSADGYFKQDPARFARLGSFVFVGGFIFLWLFLAVFHAVIAWPFLLGVAVGGVILAVFVRALPARTAKGVAAYEQLQGLKLYMYTAEKDRLQKLESPDARYAADAGAPVRSVELFEKLLPYAIVMGVETGWAKQFEGIYTSPPEWYSGNFTAFNAGYLVGSLNSGFNSAVTTGFSAPSSSSSSGFGGGGFSGGGGGGGGGGGW